MPLMRGAIPSPRAKLAGATPFALPPVAVPSSFIVIPKLQMWGNDVNGDCVTAEEAFAKSYSGVLVSDADVIAWATARDFLNGAMLSDVLERMETDGFPSAGKTYDDGTHKSVDWTNDVLLRAAIAQGPVKIGIAADQVEAVYNGKNGWFLTGAKADPNEDHCVSLTGFGALGYLAAQLGVTVPPSVNASAMGYALFTWCTIGIIDVPSMLAITAEAWLRTPTTVIK